MSIFNLCVCVSLALLPSFCCWPRNFGGRGRRFGGLAENGFSARAFLVPPSSPRGQHSNTSCARVKCKLVKTDMFHVCEKSFSEVDVQSTPLQKVQQVFLWIPATILAPYEPPWSRLSENMKFKKICRGTLIYYSWYCKFFFLCIIAKNKMYTFLVWRDPKKWELNIKVSNIWFKLL